MSEPATIAGTDLLEENRSLRRSLEAMNLSLWHQTLDRFHGFDSIRDGFCPSCGGPVEVERRGRADDGFPEGVRLVAVRL